MENTHGHESILWSNDLMTPEKLLFDSPPPAQWGGRGVNICLEVFIIPVFNIINIFFSITIKNQNGSANMMKWKLWPYNTSASQMNMEQQQQQQQKYVNLHIYMNFIQKRTGTLKNIDIYKNGKTCKN